MFERFLYNNKNLRLFDDTDRILLTVSGGIDSIAMLFLFEKTSIDFAVAHCNFHLRGIESDGDQQFVQDLTKTLNREFYTINFETDSYANEHGISTQMAARDLRYKWFKEIAAEHNFNKIATAHNRDDVVETFLLNITRGTGIRGLTGILPVNGEIIRPMLFASRADIESYITTNKIEYREDSSNAESKYKRNLFRHQVIPILKELNPSFAETVIHETIILQSVNRIYQQRLNEIKADAFSTDNDTVLIDIQSLQNNNVDLPILYNLFEPYGFTWSDIGEIYLSFESQPGKKFYSENYLLIKDRNKFIIEKRSEDSISEVTIINKSDYVIKTPLGLKLTHFQKSDDFCWPSDEQKVSLDFDKIKFPIQLRHWRKGDFFYPLGTKGRKKISDFFVDIKIPLSEKNKVWILTSNEDIIWIVGYRIDDRYKITHQTKNILMIERIN